MKKTNLMCSQCLQRNYQVAVGNKRIEIKKYCPKCNSHTLHKENKWLQKETKLLSLSVVVYYWVEITMSTFNPWLLPKLKMLKTLSNR